MQSQSRCIQKALLGIVDNAKPAEVRALLLN